MQTYPETENFKIEPNELFPEWYWIVSKKTGYLVTQFYTLKEAETTMVHFQIAIDKYESDTINTLQAENDALRAQLDRANKRVAILQSTVDNVHENLDGITSNNLINLKWYVNVAVQQLSRYITARLKD